LTGAELRAIRRELGLTLNEFGIALGYTGSRNTISVQIRRYEAGTRDIPPWIGRLAWYMGKYGVPPGWLVQDMGNSAGHGKT
jgi:transcriptional regulator with XRE-family HTH domain